ncbi:hypothetical protein SE17_38250 [Kouleothrix aurantiaca]|uniref:Uncharacterized protein n=1 Tax=Kouleothrix aurantiaca TaxID=186479 RepID=A0A0P9H309_9CHLR|nr:hypothetical protein SE17_38250 [Kouleothrix aurantiaca]
MSSRELVRQEWVKLLDTFSRDFAGTMARLEVVGTGGAQHVIVDHMPFAGMTADLKDGEDSVVVSFAQGENGVFDHTVSDVQNVSIDELNGRVARVEIASGDGTTTVFSLHDDSGK